jgi:hypothetical protein
MSKIHFFLLIMLIFTLEEIFRYRFEVLFLETPSIIHTLLKKIIYTKCTYVFTIPLYNFHIRFIHKNAIEE